MLLPTDEEKLIVTIDQNPQVQSAFLRYASFSWLFFLSRHLYLKCCVVRCGSKNIYHEDACLNENEVGFQNLLTTLHSIVHTIGGPMYFLEE